MNVALVGSSFLLTRVAGFVLSSPHHFAVRLASNNNQALSYRALLLQKHRHFSFLSGLFDAPTFASKEQVQNALKDPKAVLLDVRSDTEIVNNGHVCVQDRAWVHAPGSPFDCPLLTVAAESLMPNKNGTKIAV